MGEKVRDVMTPDPIALPSTATLVDAARTMRDNSIGDVLVGSDGPLRGVVTDRDIVTRAIADGMDPTTTSVGDICSPEVVTVTPDQEVAEVLELMRSHAIRRVPVVDETGHPVGMVTIGDLAVELDSRSALAEISAAPPNV
ncbi:MAG: CBS domain-containing protein [Sporichthyaceae bacterium]|nr:CBS domain-containing protein [Sporichthyaceae bacterium]